MRVTENNSTILGKEVRESRNNAPLNAVIQALVGDIANFFHKQVAHNLYQQQPKIPQAKVEVAANNIGRERGERLSDLAEITGIMRNFDIGDYAADDRLKFQLLDVPPTISPRELTSTDKKETETIVSNLRDPVFWVEMLVEDFGYQFSPADLTGGVCMQEIALKLALNKWLSQEVSGDQLNEYKQVIPELATYLYQRLVDPKLSLEQACKNYSQDYFLWSIIGKHNNEIAIAIENDSDPTEDEKQGRALETVFYGKKPSETAVKPTISLGLKLNREEADEITDYFRSTILIDGLFDRIDHIKILETVVNNQEAVTLEQKSALYDQFLKDERTEILAIYLDKMFDDLIVAGFEIPDKESAIKSTITGYSDLTVKVKKGNKYYEIQLQTDTTLKNKAKETTENDIRKDFLDNIYNSSAGLLNSFERGGDKIDPLEIKNLIQEIVLIESESEFTSLSLEKIATFIGEDKFDNLDKLELENLINSIWQVRIPYRESIARSRILYGVASFLSTEKDFENLMSKLKEKHQNKFKDKISKVNIDFSKIEPKFETISNPVTRLFVLVVDQNGENRILLVEKNGIKGKGNLTTPGGSSLDIHALENLDKDSDTVSFQHVLNSAYLQLITETELKKNIASNSGELNVSIMPITDSQGNIVSYGVVNPSTKEAVSTQIYPTMVILQVKNFGDIAVDPTGLENNSQQPIWLSIDEFFGAFVRTAISLPEADGQRKKPSEFNANLAQTPTRVLLPIYLKMKQIAETRAGDLEFNAIPVLSGTEAKEKPIATGRTIAYIKQEDGQKQLLYFVNDTPPEDKMYNFLPKSYYNWLKLDSTQKLKLASSGLCDYFEPDFGSSPEKSQASILQKFSDYNKFYKLCEGKILKPLEERKKLAFTPKPAGSIEFPGGKIEDLSPQEGALKEFMEETGLLTKKSELENQSKTSPDNENIQIDLGNINQIISKLTQFYKSYKSKNILQKKVTNQNGNLAEINYLTLDLKKVLGMELVTVFNKYLLANTTLNSQGKPDDNHRGFGFMTQKEWLEMQKRLSTKNWMVGGYVVDHSRLDYELQEFLYRQ